VTALLAAEALDELTADVVAAEVDGVREVELELAAAAVEDDWAEAKYGKAHIARIATWARGRK
jgi:hypothetical protein